MGKLEEYLNGRSDGMLMALNIAKQRGIEGLKEEIRYRGHTGINTVMTKKELEKTVAQIRDTTMDTMIILATSVLRDGWGWGEIRLQRFMDRMCSRASCLTDDLVTWKDLQESIKAETGLELDIR